MHLFYENEMYVDSKFDNFQCIQTNKNFMGPIITENEPITQNIYN